MSAAGTSTSPTRTTTGSRSSQHQARLLRDVGQCSGRRTATSRAAGDRGRRPAATSGSPTREQPRSRSSASTGTFLAKSAAAPSSWPRTEGPSAGRRSRHRRRGRRSGWSDQGTLPSPAFHDGRGVPLEARRRSVSTPASSRSACGIAIDAAGRVLVDRFREQSGPGRSSDLNGPDTTITGRPASPREHLPPPSRSRPTSRADLRIARSTAAAPTRPCMSGVSLTRGSPRDRTPFYVVRRTPSELRWEPDLLSVERSIRRPRRRDHRIPTSLDRRPRTASFSFTANEGGSTFVCARDSVTAARVLRRRRHIAVASGDHTFDVGDRPGRERETARFLLRGRSTPRPRPSSITSGPSGYVQRPTRPSGSPPADRRDVRVQARRTSRTGRAPRRPATRASDRGRAHLQRARDR